MKTLTLLLALTLTIAGSAYAQSDTSATTAALGVFPNGTAFNGVPISSLQIAVGVLIGTDGIAEGHVAISLIGSSVLGAPPQVIEAQADAGGGSRAAANVVTISGTCSIDMGNGTPPLTGVPFVA